MITKDMIVNDIVRAHMELVPVFFSYGMHCLGCPASAGESLEDACAVHGIDADALVQALNEALTQSQEKTEEEK